MGTDDHGFLSGDSGMAEAIRRFDWSTTPLGPPAGWSPTLKTTVALVLGSKFPQAIVWGPDLLLIYNDAFIPILGNKPAPLGRPFDQVWAEAWEQVRVIADDAFAGRATFIEDFPLLVERGGAPEQAYFTCCYSPIRDETGKVVGLLETVNETTTEVGARRRWDFLDQLGAALQTATEADAIMATTTRMTAEHLQVTNCAYADMDADEDGFTIRDNWVAEGSPSIVGHYSLADFGKLAVQNLGVGKPLVINDNLKEIAPEEAATFQAIGIAATVCMPLVKYGKLTALMAVHDRVPRTWTDYELSLIAEVTARSWAHIERVRADAEVRAAAAALSDLNATLEQRVEERTAQLVEAESALRQSQKLEAIGQLTGGVAHDFNNLLTPIIGALDILERRAVGDERVQRLVGGALQSADRAKTLVQRLLAFARRQPLQPKPVDIAGLVAGMAELISSTSGPRIEVVVDVAPDLPSALADRNQLEMAVLNLSVNARDAMPDGGRLTIAAWGQRIEEGRQHGLRPGQYVRLTVSDTGIGMDQATAARAIEPFFSTKGIGRGTGLGLSMVHGLAAQLGGALVIDSHPGVGTSIALWLPVASEAASATESRTAAPAPSGVGTALLVDDEELVRTATAEMLASLGFSVVEACSAEDARQRLRAGLRPAVIVTDHLMPGMTGTEFAHALQAEGDTTPVLLISGYAYDDDASDQLPRLSKPFREHELGQMLRQLLEPSGATSQRQGLPA